MRGFLADIGDVQGQAASMKSTGKGWWFGIALAAAISGLAAPGAIAGRQRAPAQTSVGPVALECRNPSRDGTQGLMINFESSTVDMYSYDGAGKASNQASNAVPAQISGNQITWEQQTGSGGLARRYTLDIHTGVLSWTDGTQVAGRHDPHSDYLCHVVPLKRQEAK